MSSIEGLAFFLEMNLSRENYQLLRNSAMARNCPIYPSYKLIVLAKIECLPRNIQISPVCVWVAIQDVLDHQIKRLVTQELRFKLQEILDARPTTRFICYVKFGADGSSGHALYRHQGSCDQKSMFVSQMTLVQLRAETDESSMVVFSNRYANSPYGCIPLRYAFESETTELSKIEGQRLRQEVQNLTPIVFNGLTISFKALPTLVDGKVKTNWSEAPSDSCNNCYICNASPRQMGERHGNFIPYPHTLEFGFSILHLKIRVLEWLMKGYLYKDIESWSCPAEFKFLGKFKII